MESTIETKTWAVDPAHSEILFKVKHMMVSTVTGSFDEFNGTLKTTDSGFEDAQIEFRASTKSINTRNADRDKHLNSDDFFNSEKYPEMKFISKSFKKQDDSNYILVGDLTIRDVTREVTLSVTHEGTAVDPYGQKKAGFEITGKLNRKDFDLKWDAVTEAGNIVVSNEVNLVLNVQLIEN